MEDSECRVWVPLRLFVSLRDFTCRRFTCKWPETIDDARPLLDSLHGVRFPYSFLKESDEKLSVFVFISNEFEVDGQRLEQLETLSDDNSTQIQFDWSNSDIRTYILAAMNAFAANMCEELTKLWLSKDFTLYVDDFSKQGDIVFPPNSTKFQDIPVLDLPLSPREALELFPLVREKSEKIELSPEKEEVRNTDDVVLEDRQEEETKESKESVSHMMNVSIDELDISLNDDDVMKELDSVFSDTCTEGSKVEKEKKPKVVETKDAKNWFESLITASERSAMELQYVDEYNRETRVKKRRKLEVKMRNGNNEGSKMHFSPHALARKGTFPSRKIPKYYSESERTVNSTTGSNHMATRFFSFRRQVKLFGRLLTVDECLPSQRPPSLYMRRLEVTRKSNFTKEMSNPSSWSELCISEDYILDIHPEISGVVSYKSADMEVPLRSLRYWSQIGLSPFSRKKDIVVGVCSFIEKKSKEMVDVFLSSIRGSFEDCGMGTLSVLDYTWIEDYGTVMSDREKGEKAMDDTCVQFVVYQTEFYLTTEKLVLTLREKCYSEEDNIYGIILFLEESESGVFSFVSDHRIHEKCTSGGLICPCVYSFEQFVVPSSESLSLACQIYEIARLGKPVLVAFPDGVFQPLARLWDSETSDRLTSISSSNDFSVCGIVSVVYKRVVDGVAVVIMDSCRRFSISFLLKENICDTKMFVEVIRRCRVLRAGMHEKECILITVKDSGQVSTHEVDEFERATRESESLGSDFSNFALCAFEHLDSSVYVRDSSGRCISGFLVSTSVGSILSLSDVRAHIPHASSFFVPSEDVGDEKNICCRNSLHSLITHKKGDVDYKSVIHGISRLIYGQLQFSAIVFNRIQWPDYM